jgi:hypothetical protein
MKKNLCYTISCLSGIFVLLSMASCKDHHREGSEGALYIYPLAAPSGISKESARELISKFTGDTAPVDLVQSDDSIIYYTSKNDLNTTFEQDLKTGNFTFNKNMNRYMGGYTPKLPGIDEAVERAAAFLKENQLYPKTSAELKLVHKGGLRSQGIVDGKKGGPIVDKLITLTYGRVLDSLPVIGPGSKIVINLGDAGEIAGVIHRWREVNQDQRKRIEPGEMLSQEEATERARKQIAAEYGEKTSFKINAISKAYYDNNGRFLQPVYSFETTINLNEEDKNIKPLMYLCVIPLLKNSPEPLQLITVDPRAKEMIKTGRAGQQDSTNKGKDRRTND